MRISSPPTTHSCFYGIDTPERGELLAARHDVDEMAELIGADSLAFISIDGLYRALGKTGRDPAQPHYCDACFTGDYPIALPDQADNADRHISACSPKSADGFAARRTRRAGHRRQPRHRRGDRRSDLARLGAHVVITARTQGGLEETDDAIRARWAALPRCCRWICVRRPDRRDRPEPVPALRPARHSGARRRRAGAADPGARTSCPTTGPTWSRSTCRPPGA